MRTSRLLLHAYSVFSFVLLLLAGMPLRAQTDPNLEQGLKPYGSYQGGDIDNISLTNGHLTIRAPFYSLPQRGGRLKLSFSTFYDNNGFLLNVTCAPPPAHSCNYRVLWKGSGLQLIYDHGMIVSSQWLNSGQTDANGNPAMIPVFSVTSPDGSQHVMELTTSGNYETIDGTGIRFDFTSGGYNTPAGTITDANGVKYPAQIPGVIAEDANGNQISSSGSAYTDTLGRIVPYAPPPFGVTGGNLSSCPQLSFPYQSVNAASEWNLPGPTGGSMAVTVCYASVPMRTSLCMGLMNCAEYSGSQQMIQSIVLPNGRYWAFQYEAANPNDSTSIAYGDLLKVILPTGGSISYVYASQVNSCLASNSYTSAFRRSVQTKTVDANDGTGGHTWTYTWANQNSQTQVNQVVDPLNQKSLHTITGLGQTCSNYETQAQYFDASGNLLKTVNTDYAYNLGNPLSTYGSTPLTSSTVPIRTTTTWPNGKVTKTETDYDAGFSAHDANYYWVLNPNTCNTCVPTYGTSAEILGKPVAVREYDYGINTPGALLRQTRTSYVWQTNSNYLNFNLLYLISGVSVYDGASNLVSSATYNYDETAPSSSGVSTQHNSSPANDPYRGNQTAVSRWQNGSAISTTNCPVSVNNGNLVVHQTILDTGMMSQSTDACGTSPGDPNHTTTFAYSSAFAGAYATSITNALGQTASTNYDFNTGLVVSQTDLNGQITTLSYDSMRRPTQVNNPDGGQASWSYNDATFPLSLTATIKINSTQNKVVTAIVDGLGRETETQLNSDPTCASPGTKVDTTYDALGRKASVTNPFCTTSDSTYGVTRFSSDALSRTTQVTHPDGSVVTTSYAGQAIEVTDEGNGTRPVQRISQSDGLGRLLSICEVTSATLTGTGGTPAACGLDISGTGFLTTYTYDTLNNLTNVSQGGFLARSFTYDSLSRLTQATNPESNAISYAYDANGNVITKTDARNITTTYSYDNLNRLTAKSYSDSTPSASFIYDACPAGGCPSGIAPNLPIGRMVKAYTGNTQNFFSYDPMGRSTNEWQCTPVNCGTSYFALAYGHDLAGDLTSQSNGFGVTLTNAFDNATRLTTVTSSLSDAAHPANLLSGVQYNALGLPRAESLGNNVSEALGYDTRMRLVSLTATSPTATPATPGTGTVTVNGSESSPKPPVAATASVTISGSEQRRLKCVRLSCFNWYDSGKVFITVNGHEYDYSFSGSDSGQDTASTVAAGLVSAIRADGARVVNASCSDSPCSTPTITLTAINAGGAGNNISFITGDTYDTANFASPSFTASPASGNLSGGTDTTYDTGTVTITVNGVATSASYNSGSTANALAATLASGLSSGSLVNATASGNAITITSKTLGSGTNYSLAVSSSSSNGFSPPSFTPSITGCSSNCALTGGTGASPGTAYSFSMTYAPNGNVLSANDTANGNWTYAYDDINRLLSSNKNSGQQTYSYVYDRFGNRLQQNGPYTMQLTFTGNNNRMDGYTYDAAGNVTYDLNNNYTYDAENRIVQVSGTLGATTYVYDAAGQRVRKIVAGVTTDYVYDLAGNTIAEVNASGAANREEIYAGGKHIATYVNNTTYFIHADWLGTERVRSDMTGAPCETIASLPFGDGQTTSGSCGDPSTRHFTGKERDAETGNDDFGARYYSSTLGRWLSVDWSTVPTPIPYANLTSPQTLNLYAMVGDNPGTFADLDGHMALALNGAGFECGMNCGCPFAVGGQCELDKIADAYAAYNQMVEDSRNSAPPDPQPQQQIGDASGEQQTQHEDPQQGGITPTPAPTTPPVPPVIPAVEGAAGTATETGTAASAGAGSASAAAVVGLVVVDVGLAIYDSIQAYKLYQSYHSSKDKPNVEPTPTNRPEIYEPVRGTPGKRNKITGEIWEKDKFHKDHYEVYKNKKDYENGKRDRAVWDDGRTKEKF